MLMKKLLVGDIKPAGWILEQMNKDLAGFVGNLDDIVPDMIKDDDIYGKKRLTKNDKKKDVGAIAQDADWEVQYLWWNSETQSNWLDGFLRNSYLCEHKEYSSKAKKYMGRVIAAQDEDGYIGIYDRDLRFDFNSENGELWAQATFFRVALAFYEITKDKEVYDKIKKAFDVIMSAYPVDASNPFGNESNYAGLCHGLMIVDACYTMYKLSEDAKYLHYAEWLYRNYSNNDMSENDIQMQNLNSYDHKFFGHGVHTYEHLRALIIANIASDGKYNKELNAYLNKLTFCLTPSGGPIGDEWVFQRTANATDTGYEYCSIQELLDSYTLLLETTGDMQWAEKIENILFNAGFGARHPHKSMIAYCKTDNSYAMMGRVGGMGVGNDLRYKYSVAHQDAAVCCVPNAGRIIPYYVSSIFMGKENGIAVALYGPSKLKTYMNNVKVVIEQETQYPFDLNVNVKIKSDAKNKFTLTLRKPVWADDFNLNVDDADVEVKGDEILITKEWYNDIVNIEFITSIKENNDLLGHCFYSYGALLYALPIESEEIYGRVYAGKYQDIGCSPINNDYMDLRIMDKTKDSMFLVDNIDITGFVNPPTISCAMYNTDKQKEESVNLIPLGSTILRKVTFKKHAYEAN